MKKLISISILLFLSTSLLISQNRHYSTSSKEGFKQMDVAVIDTLHYMDGSGVLYTSNSGGYVVGTNGYGDLGKYQRFDVSQPYFLNGYIALFAEKGVVGTADSITFVVKNVDTDGAPSSILHSQTVTTNYLDTTNWTSFAVNPPLLVSDTFFIGFEWTVALDDSFGLISDATGNGDTASRSWEKFSDGSYFAMSSSSSWGLDIDLWIGAILDDVNLIPISQAREDLNSDLIPDRLGDTVTVKGIVISPNYQTSHRSYYINDGTGGLATFRAGLGSPDLNLGDEVLVNGTIDHFNGLTEIAPLTDTSLVVLSDSNTIPYPIILSLEDYFADPEAYEGFLVAFGCLNKVSGTWPSNTSATLKFTDGVDTIDIRIDSDTDIDNNTEPTYPADIIGIGSQFITYQILPRYYATDFLPCGTIPVELVSFSANISDGAILLSWTTATEKNNRGFDVEKSIDNKTFTKIGFVNGNGTTTEVQLYSFIDNNLERANKYYYRLKQIDYNGSFSYSQVINVIVNSIPSIYNLMQNYPNPFNPSTTISFSLAVDSKVTVKVFNVLGQEVLTLLNGSFALGKHDVNFNASNLNSGVYFYRIDAKGIDGTNFISVKKMILTK